MSKEYKHVKNYVHNEMGFNKPHLEALVIDFVEKSIDKRVSDLLNSKWIEGLITRKVGDVISNSKSYDAWATPMEDYIKNEIKSQVKTEVLNRIDFDSLKIKG